MHDPDVAMRETVGQDRAGKRERQKHGQNGGMAKHT
jgi:hypothetical protein